MLHYNVKIIGVVQGVGFRLAALKKAREFGIVGFVENQSDGSVYIEAEGPDANLQKFIEWCHYGPSRSKIESIEISTSQLKSFSDFSINR